MERLIRSDGRVLNPVLMINFYFIMSAVKKQEDFKHEDSMMKVSFLEDEWVRYRM